MKNFNYLLAAAMTLTLSTAIFAVDATEITRCNNAIALKKEAESKQAVTDKNLICKMSPNKKFFGIMMRNEQGRGTSVTVYDLDTNAVVITVTSSKSTKTTKITKKTVTKQTTIRDFNLTDTTLEVKERKHLKAKTYNLTTILVKCKKCNNTVLETAVGSVIKARAYGIVPASKK